MRKLIFLFLIFTSNIFYAQRSETVKVSHFPGNTLVNGESKFICPEFIQLQTTNLKCFDFLKVNVYVKASGNKENPYLFKFEIENNSSHEIFVNCSRWGFGTGGADNLKPGQSNSSNKKLSEKYPSVKIYNLHITYDEDTRSKYPFYYDYTKINCGENPNSLMAKMAERKKEEDIINNIKEKIRKLGDSENELNQKLNLLNELKNADKKKNYDSQISNTKKKLQDIIDERETKNSNTLNNETEDKKTEKKSFDDSSNSTENNNYSSSNSSSNSNNNNNSNSSTNSNSNNNNNSNSSSNEYVGNDYNNYQNKTNKAQQEYNNRLLKLKEDQEEKRRISMQIEENFQETIDFSTHILKNAFEPNADINLIKASQSPEQALQNFSNELRQIEKAQERQYAAMIQQINKISKQIATAQTQSEKNANVAETIVSGGALAASIIKLKNEKKKIEQAYYKKIDGFKASLIRKNNIDVKNSLAYAIQEPNSIMEDYYIKLSEYHACFNQSIRSNFSYQNTNWTTPRGCSEVTKPNTQSVTKSNYDIAVRKYYKYKDYGDKNWLDASKYYLNKEIKHNQNNAKAYFFRAQLSDHVIDKLLDVRHAVTLDKSNTVYLKEHKKVNENYRTSFFNAIEKNDLPFIKKAIKYNLQFGIKSNEGNSSIIESIAQDKKEILNLLIRSIPSHKTIIKTNIQNYLYIANQNNALKTFKLLENYGADREYESATSGSVLYNSIQYNSKNITKYLLEKEVNIETTLAFIKKKQEKNYLYTLGQSVFEHTLLNHKTIDTNTVLQNLETVLSYDKKAYYAKIEGYQTSLDYVIDYDLEYVFELFLKHGVDINTTSKPDNSLVSRSIKQNSNTIFDILIRENVTTNDVITVNGTLLHVALKAKNEHALNTLLKKNIPINVSDKENNTALILACMSKNNRITNKILDLNPSLNSQNINGNTALHILIQNKMLNTAERVIDLGAKVNSIDNTGKSAIHYAVIANDIKIVTKLIDNNADILIEDKKSNSPLKLARKYKNEEIITLLKNQKKLDSKYSCSSEINHIKCKSGSNGTVKVTVQYGTPPYNYSWEHNKEINSNQITGVKAGEYTVTITDHRMQTLKKTVLVKEPDSLSVNIEKTNESHFDYADGKAKAIVNGGAAPYKYLWSDSTSSQKKHNLKRGRYDLIVTDKNNCSANAFVTIEGDRKDEIAKLNLAKSYISLDKNRKAVNTLSKLLKINPNNKEALLLRSKVNYNTNKNKHALEDLNKLIDLEPTAYEAIEYRIKINENTDSKENLVNDYTSLINYNKHKYADLYYKRGLLYFEEGENKSSESDFTSNIKSDSINELSYYYRALLLIKRDKVENASRDIKKINIITLDQEKVDNLNLIALNYYNKGLSQRQLHADSAITNFTNAILVSEFHTDSYYERGTLFYGKEMYQTAIKDFTLAVNENTEHLKAYYSRGQSYFKTQQFIDAISDFDKVTMLDKKHEQAFYFQGLSYVKLEKHSKAITSFSHAIKIKKTNKAYFAQGLSYYALTNYKSAVKSFQNAINENESHEESYYHKGLSLKKLNQLKKAEAEFKKAVKVNIHYLEAYQEKAETNMSLEKYKTAIKDFTHVMKIDSLDTQAYISRSKAYKELKKYSLAVNDLEEVVKLDHSLLNKELIFEMAYLNKKMKNYDEAIELYKKSIESISDTEAIFAIAGIYSTQKKTEECLKWVEKTLISNALYSKKIKKSKEFKNMKKNKEFQSLIEM